MRISDWSSDVCSSDLMDSIIRSTENDPAYRGILHARDGEPEATGADAISAAASQVATTLSTASIVTYTMSGSTAMRAARQRPSVPIMVLTKIGRAHV